MLVRFGTPAAMMTTLLALAFFSGISFSSAAANAASLKRATETRSVCCLLPGSKVSKFMNRRRCKARNGQLLRPARCRQVQQQDRYRRVAPSRLGQVLKRRHQSRRTTPAQPRGGPRLASPSGPDLPGIYCAGGAFLPCWCSGESSCNQLIAACASANQTIHCTDHNEKGQPTGCSCS